MTLEWAGIIEILAVMIIALYLLLLLPHLTPVIATTTSLIILATFMNTNWVFEIYQSPSTNFYYASMLLIAGHLFFLIKQRGSHSIATSNNKHCKLAIKYQKEGQLELAFRQFSQCVMDDPLMDKLYELVLDCERQDQRQVLVKALEFMARHNATYKDIKEKIKQNKTAQETAVFGSPKAGHVKSNVNNDGQGLNTIGRFIVEKEIGKGAMGIVYQGQDPKINRTVAIKTLPLSHEFEENELDEAKQRFFREAESAGRLTHPNIVTIYDVGEEDGLAYIAMEYLKGHELTRYTKPEKLLPIANVLQIAILAAEALDYAHKQNIVHRDIKPANVMFVTESSTIKVTDFGIARITDSNRTKTGIVLGTPSYMSPEQLAGNKIDGRSDLFSLGVMFYQLLSGGLPFVGDSMATLMFQIAKEPHRNILDLRPELKKKSPCVLPVVDKILEKDSENRYLNGNSFALELRNCLRIIKKK